MLAYTSIDNPGTSSYSPKPPDIQVLSIKFSFNDLSFENSLGKTAKAVNRKGQTS